MAYYIADWLDQEIFVDITCDEGTDISELPTHFCPGSTATVGGSNAKKYILSASHTWEELPSSGGGESESGTPAFTEKLQDYAYKMDYPALDYDNAYKYFKSGGDLSTTACSALRSDNLIGRNLDWFYSNMADMVIRTPHTDEYKAVIGTAGAVAELTEEFIQSGEKSDAYKIAPFKLQDGVNEDGLFACMNVVPTDYGENITTPTDTQEVEINGLMLVRFVLDRFSTAIEAATYIRKHCKVYFPTALHDLGYEVHLFLADSTSSYAVEFVENVAEVVDITDTPYITNFFRYGVTLNADNTVMTPATGDAIEANGITEYGAGLERHNIIANGIDDVTDKASMRQMLDELKYTRMYCTSPDYANPAWLTEYVGGDLKVNSEVSAFDDIIIASGDMFTDRDRDNPLTWQTTHSVIYDIGNKTMNICFQEDSIEYGFDVSGNKLPKLEEKTLTLGASSPSTVLPDSGYDGLSSVPITIDNTVIKAENIKKDVSVLGVTGTLEAGAAKAKFVNTTMSNSVTWTSVTYGNGKFVAVANSGVGSHICYSTDGVSWTSTESENNYSWSSVTYGNGKFVAVSRYSGGKSALGYSIDGINWTVTTAEDRSSWTSVAYGNGKFVAVSGGYYVSSAYSTDGINWTISERFLSGEDKKVAYGNDKFVIVEYNSDRGYYSTDGINWTITAMPSMSLWSGIAYGNGKFIAACSRGKSGAYSTDGINWVAVTLPVYASPQPTDIAYGNGMFIIVAGDANIEYSFDGVTWLTSDIELTPETIGYGGGKFIIIKQGFVAYCDMRMELE